MKNSEPITKYMATQLITFNPETDIMVAIKTILRKKISGAPVLNKKGDMIGIISEKDCLRLLLEGPYDLSPGGNGTVGDFMSSNVKTISADSSVVDAAYEFAFTNYRRMPVVENGKLVGQISRRDILKAIEKIKPVQHHVPSSWKPRVPVVPPSKRSYNNKNT